jgi:hypothetical protein
MAVYFVHNFVWKRWVLRYDDDTGASEEIEATGEEELEDGFYVDPGRDLGFDRPDQPATGQHVGYYDTDQGPVFFHNTQRWPLSEGTFRPDVRKSEHGYEFRLWEGDALRVEARYRGPAPGHWNWPEDMELQDPFQWLAKHLPTPGFYARRITFTLEEARAILAAVLAEPSRKLAGEDHLRAGQAMVVLLEDGAAAERETAANVLVQRSLGHGYLRRLLRKYADRDWDASHPVVRVFQRHRDSLGDGGRATLRHCFRADPVRQAALEPLLERPPE